MWRGWNGMTKAESRVAAMEAARAAESREPTSAGVMIARPGAFDERSKHRTNAERVVIRLLSQRRRFELLEPLLATAFRSPDAFVQRRTNLKLAVLAKYSEMNEIGPMYFQGKDGAEELYELFLWFRSLADQVVQRHSTAEWLLLIRRTFLAPLDSVAMPPAWFVESILRRSRTPTTKSDLVGRTFHVSPRILEDVHDLLMTTTAMWYLGQSFRTVSKGIVISIIDPSTFFGVGFPTGQTARAAIALFDARRERWRDSSAGIPLPSVGVHGRKFAVEGGEHRHGEAVVGWYESDSEQDRDRHFLRWRTHHFPEFIDPDSVFGLNTGQRPSTRSLAASGAMWACWKDAGMPEMKYRIPKGSWNLWGVQEIRIDALQHGLREWSQIATKYDPDWNPEIGLAELMRSSTDLNWIDADYALVCPFTPATVLVDLVGASRALNEGHVRPSGGADANEWTKLFETQVQEVVDGTPWRPSDEVRGLIGRTLHLQGNAITDIDAVAERDGTVLLIDAKAWATPATLEFGEFWAVNTRRRTVEKAVSQWQQKMEIVRQNPHVLGLTKAPRILGVVVAPEAPYVLPGACTEEVVAGLLAASSLPELEYCLSVRDGDGGSSPRNSGKASKADWRGLLGILTDRRTRRTTA
jgi:hypothetical protein